VSAGSVGRAAASGPAAGGVPENAAAGRTWPPPPTDAGGSGLSRHRRDDWDACSEAAQCRRRARRSAL